MSASSRTRSVLRLARGLRLEHRKLGFLVALLLPVAVYSTWAAVGCVIQKYRQRGTGPPLGREYPEASELEAMIPAESDMPHNQGNQSKIF